MSAILLRSGFEVCVAKDGNEGLAVFQEEQPEVVITDLFMPDKEGIETIRELKKGSPKLKIIAMSGGSMVEGPDYLIAAKLLGADLALSKPFGSEELVNTVNKLLGKDIGNPGPQKNVGTQT